MNIPKINICKENLVLTNQIRGRITIDAMVPGINGIKPTPKPEQKKVDKDLIIFG